MSEGSFQEVVDRKRRQRMDAIDRLDPEHRKLVHVYGYHIVKTLIDVGVTKPTHIRHVVETILDEFSPSRGSYSQQGVRTQIDEQ